MSLRESLTQIYMVKIWRMDIENRPLKKFWICSWTHIQAKNVYMKSLLTSLNRKQKLFGADNNVPVHHKCVYSLSPMVCPGDVRVDPSGDGWKGCWTFVRMILDNREARCHRCFFFFFSQMTSSFHGESPPSPLPASIWMCCCSVTAIRATAMERLPTLCGRVWWLRYQTHS